MCITIQAIRERKLSITRTQYIYVYYIFQLMLTQNFSGAYQILPGAIVDSSDCGDLMILVI